MHMHAAEHVAKADHLQVIENGVIALALSNGLIRPIGKREGTHGGDAELLRGRFLRQGAPKARHMFACLLHAVARRADRFDLRLQHFRCNAVAEAFLCGGDEFLAGSLHRAPRLRVENEIFLFDPERIHGENNG
jgi:hypothetical protein